MKHFIRVWNNKKHVFAGFTHEFIDDNGGDQEIVSMIVETMNTGHPVIRVFPGSGEWTIHYRYSVSEDGYNEYLMRREAGVSL